LGAIRWTGYMLCFCLCWVPRTSAVPHGRGRRAVIQGICRRHETLGVDFEARSFVCQTGPIPEAKFARVAFVRAAFQVVRDLGAKNISVCNHRAC